MLGNDVDIDPRGFLKDENDMREPKAELLLHIRTKIGNTLETGVLSKRKVELKGASNCWICEGWTQVLFRYKPAKLEEVDPYDAIYIHFSFEEEQKDLMEFNEEAGEYQLLRMVPPGKVKYFFTKNEDKYEGKVSEAFYRVSLE